MSARRQHWHAPQLPLPRYHVPVLFASSFVQPNGAYPILAEKFSPQTQHNAGTSSFQNTQARAIDVKKIDGSIIIQVGKIAPSHG
jgi:hypothetical protein